MASDDGEDDVKKSRDGERSCGHQTASNKSLVGWFVFLSPLPLLSLHHCAWAALGWTTSQSKDESAGFPLTRVVTRGAELNQESANGRSRT